MIVLVVVTLALLGATTWSALELSEARYPVLQRRLTGVGLALCVLALIAMMSTAAESGI
jgi:hypothetical protein